MIETSLLPAHAGDAGKASLAAEDFIAESGFASVLDGPDTFDASRR